MDETITKIVLVPQHIQDQTMATTISPSPSTPLFIKNTYVNGILGIHLYKGQSLGLQQAFTFYFVFKLIFLALKDIMDKRPGGP